VPPLRALVEAGYDVPLVVTRPDKRRRRRHAPEPTPVKAVATELGLPVTDRMADLAEVDADLGVVVAYGRLIGTEILTALPLVNLHFSLLPRWRGAAPVERAILAGDDTTGVCLMTVAEQLDAGDLYGCEETPVRPDDTLASLQGRLVELGTSLLLDHLGDGFPEPRPQLGEPTYAEKLTPADGHLDWTESAEHLARVVRVGNAWTTVDGHRLKVLEAEVAEMDAVAVEHGLEPGERSGVVVGARPGSLRLVRVQPEGKPARTADEWLRGARLDPSTRLGT
jgi:methionyl-tRNA formyltransferase